MMCYEKVIAQLKLILHVHSSCSKEYRDFAGI